MKLRWSLVICLTVHLMMLHGASATDSVTTNAQPATPTVADDLAKLRRNGRRSCTTSNSTKEFIALYAPDTSLPSALGGTFHRPSRNSRPLQNHHGHRHEQHHLPQYCDGVLGDLAFDSGDYSETLVPTKSGPDQHYKGDYLIVFRRQKDGHWLIVQQVWTFAGNDLLPPSK